MSEQNIPGNANCNYISGMFATPLQELLRYTPKGLQLGYEMKNEDGTVYGHCHIPLGLHCHEAADLLMKWHSVLLQLACLGNGNEYGNSEGNLIARAALQPKNER